MLCLWKRFSILIHGKEKYASSAIGSHGVYTNWYTDTGEIDHMGARKADCAIYITTMAKIKYTQPMEVWI